MTQKEFNTLKPGDKVRIVKEKTGGNWNVNGLMDKWFGKVMTVRERDLFIAKMEEDKYEWPNGWSWFPKMIECKVEDEPVEAKDKKEDKTLRKRFLTELTGEKGPFTWSDFGVEFTHRWDEVSLEMVMECFDRAMEEEE